MLVLHIEAASVNELVEKSLHALHVTLSSASAVPVPPSDVTNIADAAKKRGRPAKTETPAGASVPAVPASQAQVENSASAPAGSSPAEGVPPAGPAPGSAPGAAAAGVRTLEEARAALHSVTVRVEGDANDSAGLKRASEILTVLGYRKISDVKAEDYGKLIEMCAAMMKDLKPVATEKTT